MIDIHFYMKIHELKSRLAQGELADRKTLWEQLETCRRREAVIYNIETTNACNMRCEMCPRTTMMTRRIETLKMDTFERIASQIRPYSPEEWDAWQDFAEQKYEVDRNGMSENHFFLHIIPKVLVLHGYGDPLLDPDMAERIKLLSEKGIPSYFSCNPANIDIDKNIEFFENGLGYIKYSIESVDDFLHKKIRGNASNFTRSYRQIMKLIEEKEKRNLKTVFVITMLDLKRDDQQADFEKLRSAFKGVDTYIYLKSQDQQWYQNKNIGTKSIHWTEFCQFPWSSMTIKSDGMAVECVEDFNNEIILGNTAEESLEEIWNGEPYRKFREMHFEQTPGIKCTEQCDMKLIGSYL
jgi:radical SAM protein with 4Fe4S-binding SPASM domain